MPRFATRAPIPRKRGEIERRPAAREGLCVVVFGMTHQVFSNRDALAALCRGRKIRKLSLFGSVLAGRDRSDSDIDLLVEFEPRATPDLITIAEIEIELSRLLGRRKVDL